jgi:hypothetical protein
VVCVTTAHRIIINGCSTVLILLGYGRGGTVRCLIGSIIIAVQQNRILVAPSRDVGSLASLF